MKNLDTLMKGSMIAFISSLAVLIVYILFFFAWNILWFYTHQFVMPDVIQPLLLLLPLMSISILLLEICRELAKRFRYVERKGDNHLIHTPGITWGLYKEFFPKTLDFVEVYRW